MGGRNLIIFKTLMNRLDGNDCGSINTGKFFHKQRIERLWCDVYVKVLDEYYKLFSHTEDHNMLDVSNPIHMFSLQYIFVPRIERDLQNWAKSHNFHPVLLKKIKHPSSYGILEV